MNEGNKVSGGIEDGDVLEYANETSVKLISTDVFVLKRAPLLIDQCRKKESNVRTIHQLRYKHNAPLVAAENCLGFKKHSLREEQCAHVESLETSP